MKLKFKVNAHRHIDRSDIPVHRTVILAHPEGENTDALIESWREKHADGVPLDSRTNRWPSGCWFPGIVHFDTVEVR